MEWLKHQYKELRNTQGVEDIGRRDFLIFMSNMLKGLLAYEFIKTLNKYGLAYAKENCGCIVAWDDPYYMKAIEIITITGLNNYINKVFKEMILNKNPLNLQSKDWSSYKGAWYYIGNDKELIRDRWYFIIEKIFNTTNPVFDKERSIVLPSKYGWINQKTGKKFVWSFSLPYSDFKVFIEGMSFPFIEYVFEGHKGKKFPAIFDLQKEIFEIEEIFYVAYHGTKEIHPIENISKKKVFNPIAIHNLYYKYKENEDKIQYLEASLIYDFPPIYDIVKRTYGYLCPIITIEKTKEEVKKISLKVGYAERKENSEKIVVLSSGTEPKSNTISILVEQKRNLFSF